MTWEELVRTAQPVPGPPTSPPPADVGPDPEFCEMCDTWRPAGETAWANPFSFCRDREACDARRAKGNG